MSARGSSGPPPIASPSAKDERASSPASFIPVLAVFVKTFSDSCSASFPKEEPASASESAPAPEDVGGFEGSEGVASPDI